jgi:hypothetical protein
VAVGRARPVVVRNRADDELPEVVRNRADDELPEVAR